MRRWEKLLALHLIVGYNQGRNDRVSENRYVKRERGTL